MLKLKSIIRLAAVGLVLTNTSANANPSVTVNVDGTYYNVTLNQGSPGTDALFQSQLAAQVWFGNAILAQQFATAVGASLGMPDPGDDFYGPRFSYTAPEPADDPFLGIGNVVSVYVYDNKRGIINSNAAQADPLYHYAFAYLSSADTQSSIHTLASKLRSGFSSQMVATNFANTYDCNLFDAKGLCVSVGGQQTYVDNPSTNMTSAVVVGGYKISPTFRIGGFLNQNVNSNTGSNVDISNNSPLMGLFAVWNQNEDHLGYQLKIANAYQDMDVETTRDVIGLSEPGRGKTSLITQSYIGELSYAFMANDKTLVRPYAAVRYTSIKQDGYTEQTTAAVTAPLTYSTLSDRSTAALVGVKLNHKLNDKVNLTCSLGIEQDLYHHVDNLTATGFSGLTNENFNDNIKRTRPVASIGAYFNPAKNQRIAADLYYQQLPFQSTGSTTAYVNYTIGF